MGYLKDVPDLHTQPMRDIIYEHLRKAIVQGDLKADTYFTDAEIADEFGVSRTPVREAVQKLEMGGYIERIPMRGNRVRGLSPMELAHSFGIRKSLEVLAVRYAAVRITDAELKELKSLVGSAEEAIATQPAEQRLETIFPLVKSFNEIAFQACKSEHLTALIWAEREIFDRYRVMRVVLPNRLERSIARRRSLCEAFCARDPERAAAIWIEHLNESYTIWREKSGFGEQLKDFIFF